MSVRGSRIGCSLSLKPQPLVKAHGRQTAPASLWGQGAWAGRSASVVLNISCQIHGLLACLPASRLAWAAGDFIPRTCKSVFLGCA